MLVNTYGCGLRTELRGRAVRNGGDRNLLFPRARIENTLNPQEMGCVLGCLCTLCARQGPVHRETPDPIGAGPG
jgi:hypothetical protein